jgi:hypothetical protein
MPIRFSARVGVEPQTPQRRRGVAVLAGAILIAAAAFLLWMNRGFADYALTGWFWNQTQGVVVEARNNSDPTIEFSTPDGSTYEFKEDYIILCGGRGTFCWIRDFSLGEQVPVVYNPHSPKTAFVHDWALKSTVITVFLEAALELLLVLMMIVLLRRKPMRAEVSFESNS